MSRIKKTKLASRFRGLLPIVIDAETSGLNPATDALLEIAAVTIVMDEQGKLHPDQTFAYHVEPFAGARIDPEALIINQIDPHSPLRYPFQSSKHCIWYFLSRKIIEDYWLSACCVSGA